MAKRFRDPIAVTTGGPGRPAAPVAFRWRGRRYRVLTVLGHWREDAGYWTGGGMAIPQRDLWRLEARNGAAGSGVYEVVCEDGGWRLNRVWD
jgi:hypothetical protein